MKASIYIIIALLGTQNICLANELTQQVKTPDGFTINLPSEWMTIPKTVVDAFNESITEMVPKAEKQMYDYAFQLSEAKGWFEFPNILIHVENTGRIPEGQLKSIKQIQQTLDEGVKKVQDTMSTLLSYVKLGETVYEPSSHILWMKMTMKVNNEFEENKAFTVKGLSGMLLTEKGLIYIICYAKAEDFSVYAPVFEKIVRNTVVADDLKYKPRITDSNSIFSKIDFGKVLSRGIAFGLLAMVFALIKRKSSKDSSAEEQSVSSNNEEVSFSQEVKNPWKDYDLKEPDKKWISVLPPSRPDHENVDRDCCVKSPIAVNDKTYTLPRIFTSKVHEVIFSRSCPLYFSIVKRILEMNPNLSKEVVIEELHRMLNLPPKTFNEAVNVFIDNWNECFENRRIIENFPETVRLENKEVYLLETDPLLLLDYRVRQSSSALAWEENFGFDTINELREQFSEEGEDVYYFDKFVRKMATQHQKELRKIVYRHNGVFHKFRRSRFLSLFLLVALFITLIAIICLIK
jgi:hypothetical protein